VALEFDSLAPQKTISGASANSYLGFSVNSAGDINGDGYEDVIIGAYSPSTGPGIAYVIYGGKTASFSGIDFANMALDPAINGFTITGSATGDYFGFSVGSAGDLDNDGYDDIIIGAPNKNSQQGAVYVVYGRPKSKLQNIDLSSLTLDPKTTGFMITGNAASDWLGYPVRGGGDINGDGYDDIIVSAPQKNNRQGTVYVIYGGPKSIMTDINLSATTLDPTTTGFRITGNAEGDRL